MGNETYEFMMTYGWAILVVLTAIGFLAYFGIFNPDNFLPEKCIMPSGVSCLDFNNYGEGASILLHNTAYFGMNDINVTLQRKSEIIQCSGSSELKYQEAKMYYCNYESKGTKDKFNLNFKYANQDTGLTHTKTGELILKSRLTEIKNDECVN